MLRSSKTVEISNENSREESACSSPKNHRDVTFTEAMGKEEVFILLQENLGGLLPPSLSKKDFRIKNSSKPFNSLGVALASLSPGKLQDSPRREDQPIPRKETTPSPKSQAAIGTSPKKKSKFGEEVIPGHLERPALTLTQMDLGEERKSGNASPESDCVRRMNASVSFEKREKLKTKVLVTPSHSTPTNSMLPASFNASPHKDPSPKDKPFSPLETKKLENIRLDKETLRDLNRYTDKNFIKSIKASLRKLEIIEKISEENFRDTDKFAKTLSHSPKKKRNSTNDQRGVRFLPLISPDVSPKKLNFTRNSRLPKN